VTCDSFGGLRRLITPPSRRSSVLAAHALTPAGRWSRFRAPALEPLAREEQAGRVARVLLARYGVVFRRMLERERIPLPWRELAMVYRRMELRGEVRGGRFVQRFSGEGAAGGGRESCASAGRHALAPAEDGRACGSPRPIR
jgi:ATP-dependent Lhr-like helicase